MVRSGEQKITGTVEAVAIEATTMENAVTFARDIGIQKVMFESDSLRSEERRVGKECVP